jgi:CubicO group peptidase (beta-lactamase class C family)
MRFSFICLAIASAVLASAQSNNVAQVLKGFVDKHILPGAVVLVADKDKLLGIETAGQADIAANRAMKPDTMFWIASMAKSITAAALMILVDEGKVSLDDPVSKFIPEFNSQWLIAERSDALLTLKRPLHPITVREILSHTSGLPTFSRVEDLREIKSAPLATLPLWLAVRSYAMSSLEFEPGSKWAYSNAGFNTAGRIVEVVSGMSFEAFLKKRLFDPLGMKDTTFSPNKRQLERLAKSYRSNPVKNGFEEARIMSAEHPLTDKRHEPWPAGGLFSTAADVMRFCQLMLNKGTYRGRRILSESAVKQMTLNQVPASLGVQYGLGWFIGQSGAYLHMGAHGTIMTVFPEHNRIVVILMEHATLQQGNSWDVYNPIHGAAFKDYPSLKKVGS